MAIHPTAIHTCDGYGGMELAFRHAFQPQHRPKTVARIERDSYAATILMARMEQTRLDQAPIWDDLCTFDGTAWRGRVDWLTAGFPCQPFSQAGKRQGVDDERWLWPDIARLIDDIRPRYIFLENVTGLIRQGLPHVLTDLAALGFDAEWACLPAAAIGAPHKRNRTWILAMAHGASTRRLPRQRPGKTGPEIRPKGSGPTLDSFPPPPNGEWEQWTAAGGPQPTIRRSTNGPALGLADALHLGGNGLVPQCAAEALKQLTQRITNL